MKTVDFIFDFASPNAYLVHRVLPDIAKRTGATFNYLPCLLGGIFRATGNQAPMVQNANIKHKNAYEMLEFQRFVTKHRLAKFKMNPHFPVSSLILMRAAIAAEADGRLMEYVEAMMCHMWEAPKKMDDPAVSAAAMTESGFDGPALLARAQDEAVKKKLMENTEAAVARGVFGIPTLFVGSEMFFGKERLGQVEDMLR